LLGSALVENGDLDEAERELRRALELQPACGVSHRDLRILLSKRNRLVEAATELHGSGRLVEAAAESLVGDASGMIKIDCAEFQHSHEISKLTARLPDIWDIVKPMRLLS